MTGTVQFHRVLTNTPGGKYIELVESECIAYLVEPNILG